VGMTDDNDGETKVVNRDEVGFIGKGVKDGRHQHKENYDEVGRYHIGGEGYSTENSTVRSRVFCHGRRGGSFARDKQTSRTVSDSLELSSRNPLSTTFSPTLSSSFRCPFLMTISMPLWKSFDPSTTHKVLSLH
jgi:hypothetical protein